MKQTTNHKEEKLSQFCFCLQWRYKLKLLLSAPWSHSDGERESSTLLNFGALGGATSEKVVGSIPDGGLWDFSLTKSCRTHCGPGVDSASDRNEYQGYFLGGTNGQCVGLTTLPHSCTEYIDILGLSTSYSPQGLSRFVEELLFFLTF